MSCSVTDPRLAFHATYVDTQSHTTKEFLCVFYWGNGSVELIDAKSGKTFLKRTQSPHLTKAHFYLGANVVVFGRVLTLVRYADKVTEQLSERVSESVIAVLAEPAFDRIGDCLDIATQECSFGICDMQVTHLRAADWDTAAHGGAGSEPGPAALLPRSFCNKKVLVLHLIRDQAVAKAQQLPARFEAGEWTWVAQSKADVEEASALMNLAHRRPSADLAGPSTVVLVKPHVVSGKRGGEAIQSILSMCPQTSIQALSQLTLSSADADAFLQPYKGILKEYKTTVEHIASAPCWALQLVAKDGSNPVEAVREAVGPFDPTIAKVLRPKTLRARLGKDAARNALHCSDLPEDGADDAAFLWARGH
jgi:nucleoside-diphosphate kinase